MDASPPPSGSPPASATTTTAGRPGVVLRRSEVAKRVCTTADSLRRTVIEVVDAVGDANVPIIEKVTSIKRMREDWKEAEIALKDWDGLPTQEDSTEDLEWRQRAYLLSGDLVRQLHTLLDSRFPEDNIARALESRKKLALANAGKGEQGFRLGPLTEETLKACGEQKSISPETANANKNSFSFSYSPSAQMLTCVWQGVMRIAIKFSAKGEIERIRVIGNGEEKWPSEFDVFRELERQSRRALRDITTSATVNEGASYDDISSKLIIWFNDKRDLFTAKCSQTKRFLAFGAVGEQGELEVRPPMIRTAVDTFALDERPKADRKTEATFTDELLL